MSQQQQGQEVALRQVTQSAVAQLQDQEFKGQVEAAAREGVSPRQLLRAAATAVLDNPKLAAPALRSSLLQATLKCAQDGLLPDGRQAAFVIYRTKSGEKVQYLPMIDGLRAIAADHGWTIATNVVYENDGFDPNLDTHKANHKPTPLNQDRGKPIGAYAIAEHRDGRRVGPEVYNLADLQKVRNVSKAKDSGPWRDWWERMAEKTPGKRLFKKLSLDPKDRRIASVLQALEEEDATEALYGPAPSQDRQEIAAPQAEEEQADVIEMESTDEDLHEPSDEELAALGGAQNADNGGEAADSAEEPRFARGKFAGKTIAEVFAEGEVGIGYLRWALRAWHDDEFKQALVEFAAEHPEIGEDE